MSGDVNLTGDWVGFYKVPTPIPPTHFTAELRDVGGRVAGIIRESGDTPDCAGHELHSVIEGWRNGARLRFTKHYDYLRRAYYSVCYDGTIAPGGGEIEGRWVIPGQWSGTFMMMRARAAPTDAAERIGQEIPVG